MVKPPPTLDGARVLWWAHAGKEPFGEVQGLPAEERLIYGFAICQYDPSNSDPNGQLYRFSCNSRWEVVQDSDCDSVKEAKAGIPLQYDRSNVIWHRYED